MFTSVPAGNKHKAVLYVHFPHYIQYALTGTGLTAIVFYLCAVGKPDCPAEVAGFFQPVVF